MKKEKPKKVISPNVPVIFDPMGSYTGLPRDPIDRPIQDADDL